MIAKVQFRLDGFHYLNHKVLETSGVDQDGLIHPDGNNFRAHLLHVTMPLHAAFTAAHTILIQVPRGTVEILVGIVTFDLKQIGRGLNDWISTIIQVIALAVIAIVGIISPRAVAWFLDKVESGGWDVERVEGPAVGCTNRFTASGEIQDAMETASSVKRKFPTGVLRGLVGVVAVGDAVVIALSSFLQGRVQPLASCGIKFGLGIVSPFIGLGSCICFEPPYRQVSALLNIKA